MLACPADERMGRVLGAGGPFADRDGLFLRLTFEGSPDRGGRYAEVLVKDCRETPVNDEMLGGCLPAIVGGIRPVVGWVLSRDYASCGRGPGDGSPAGPFCSICKLYHIKHRRSMSGVEVVIQLRGGSSRNISRYTASTSSRSKSRIRRRSSSIWRPRSQPGLS